MMRCPHCGHGNPDGEIFCDYCRLRLPHPSAEDYQAMYRAQDSAWRARRWRDTIIAVVWGVAVGLALNALAISLDGHGGDPELVAMGERFWWLAGMAWGFAIWWFRRMASPER